jgi:hypothetical protein
MGFYIMQKMKNILLSCFILLLTSCLEDVPVKENTYRENFNTLWEIIDTRYCFLDSKNINWDSVKLVYQARLGTDTIDEITFFDAMAEMLAVLKDGHVNLYSGFDRSRYWKWFTDFKPNFSSSLIYNQNYLGTNYRSVNGFRYNLIAGGEVGYLYYSSFSDSFSDQNMRYVIQYFKDCKGLIIDVRNNGGGSADLSSRLASYFFTNDTVNLYIKHKTGPGHSDFSDFTPMETPAHEKIQWKRPVVVLSNRAAYSATNMFIARMKDAPKATVIGDKSGGGGGLPLSNELPNGWMVRFSSSPMFDINKADIENGILPDIVVSLDSTDMAKGRDSLIDYAVGLITGIK